MQLLMLIDVCVATICVILPPAPTVLQEGSFDACVYTRGSVRRASGFVLVGKPGTGNPARSWRKIPFTLIDQSRPFSMSANACLRQLGKAYTHRAWRTWTRISFPMGVVILRTIKLRAFWVTVAILAWIPILAAQKSKGAAPAPVPTQIGAAQKVFISNAGGESFETVIDETVFNGGPDRPYNQFYAAMAGWGRYVLVSSPADADLVFEISWALTDTGLKLPVLGQLRLVVIDPKTHVTLWNFTEYVRGAILLGNRDKNFDQAMSTIVNRVKKMVDTPAATTDATRK